MLRLSRCWSARARLRRRGVWAMGWAMAAEVAARKPHRHDCNVSVSTARIRLRVRTRDIGAADGAMPHGSAAVVQRSTQEEPAARRGGRRDGRYVALWVLDSLHWQ